MGNLASLLKQKRYLVVGSDEKMYEPMKGTLSSLKIKVFAPYREKNIKKFKPDVVVVGNAISRGNPELEYVLSNNIPYKSVSDVLLEEFIEGKKAIVIAGTHGKTTTSALVAWILECAGLDPTMFVGGFTKNFSSGAKLGKGKYVVLEGDEYGSCFSDPNPKFLNYRPFIGILNNIELDHIDIYKDLDALCRAFRSFLKLIPKNGLLVVNQEDKEARILVGSSAKTIWKKNSAPQIASFGINRGMFHTKNLKTGADGMSWSAYKREQKITKVKTSLSGTYNVSNIMAAVAVARFLNIPGKTISEAISSFQGVKRRSEIISEKNDITIIDDYAHHPTAVSETLKGLRLKYPGQKIFALFEPGSPTSRGRLHERQYTKALSRADVAYIFKPFNAHLCSTKDLFRGKEVVSALRKSGTEAQYFEKMEILYKRLEKNVRVNNIVILMSCRDFDGLRKKLAKGLIPHQ